MPGPRHKAVRFALPTPQSLSRQATATEPSILFNVTGRRSKNKKHKCDAEISAFLRVSESELRPNVAAYLLSSAKDALDDVLGNDSISTLRSPEECK